MSIDSSRERVEHTLRRVRSQQYVCTPPEAGSNRTQGQAAAGSRAESRVKRLKLTPMLLLECLTTYSSNSSQNGVRRARADLLCTAHTCLTRLCMRHICVRESAEPAFDMQLVGLCLSAAPVHAGACHMMRSRIAIRKKSLYRLLHLACTHIINWHIVTHVQSSTAL